MTGNMAADEFRADLFMEISDLEMIPVLQSLQADEGSDAHHTDPGHASITPEVLSWHALHAAPVHSCDDSMDARCWSRRCSLPCINHASSPSIVCDHGPGQNPDRTLALTQRALYWWICGD